MADIIWERLLAADHELTAAAFRHLHTLPDLAAHFDQGLHAPHLRRGCLRLLLIYDSEPLKRRLFGTLVALASVGHSDIDLVRAVIATMERGWAGAAIRPVANAILDGPLAEPWEEYRRLAELYTLFYPELLPELVARAHAHKDPDVRAVALDYR